MKYTPQERMKRLMELEEADEDCTGARAEIGPAAAMLADYTDTLPKEVGSRLWAYSTALRIYHSRVLELVCEQMRFPEEYGTGVSR